MKTFTIIANPSDFTLTIDEIWPDGDAPENPTAEDVVATMRGGVDSVLQEWNMMPDHLIITDSVSQATYR